MSEPTETSLRVTHRAAAVSIARLLLIGLSACSSYRAEPLPRAPLAAPRRPLDAPRLRVARRELHRPVDTSVPIDLSDGLTPDEAAVIAVLLNPDLIAARDAHGEAEAQVLIAGILPNPVLGAGIDHPFGPGSAGTSNALNLSLGLDLKPFIARSARRRAAAAATDQVDLGIAWHEWQVAQQARLLVVRLGWLRTRVQLAADEVDFNQRAVEAASSATHAGDATLEQLGVQRAALESVRRTLNQLEQAESETEGSLRALLGNPALDRLDVVEPTAPRAAEPVDLELCLAARLDLAALRLGYQAGEEQLRAAVLEQFPAVTVGVAYQRNEVALDFIGGFVNVELPVFNRNQGMVKLGEATRRRLEHEYDARAAGARADVERLFRFSALVGRQLPEVEQSIAPLADIELREREAVSRGDIARLSYQTVRSALFEQRLQAATIGQALDEARIGVETTCGGDVRRLH
ncbi:MAG: TolC family protein [Polyangiaceae bacterium]